MKTTVKMTSKVLAMGVMAAVFAASSVEAAPLVLDNLGTLGSFSQYSNGTYIYAGNVQYKTYTVLNTDNGLIYNRYTDASNGNTIWEQLTSTPARLVTSPDGIDVRVFDFTDLTLNAAYKIDLVGSIPAAITTTSDATLYGQVYANCNRSSGGASYQGQTGQPGQGFFPGMGGTGPEYMIIWWYQYVWPAGGGGGGLGGDGLGGTSGSPTGANPGGLGGDASPNWTFHGGSGGGGGGAISNSSNGGFYGGAGGGALWLDVEGNVTLASSAAIYANGDPAEPRYYNRTGGGGGGGSGGYIGIDANGTFDNAGVLSATGQAGTYYPYTTNQGQPPGTYDPTGPGYSAGGAGGGGLIYIQANHVSNTGTITAEGGAPGVTGNRGKISQFTTGGVACPSADLTWDCFVDMEDFALFASQWLRNDCVAPGWCGGADFDTSGEVGMEDLVELATQWLTGSR